MSQDPGQPYYEVQPVREVQKYGTVGESGWGFSAFSALTDDDAPHRVILERFASVNPQFALSIPPYDAEEDFIAGTLAWGQNEAYIYYETILSHLWVWTPNQEAAVELRSLLFPAN